MESQIDVGLGDLGTGVEKILMGLARKKKVQEDKDSMYELTGPQSGKDDVTDSYLSAALKYAGEDPEMANEMLKKALERANNVAEANTKDFRADPKKFVTFHDKSGRIDINSAIREKLKQDAKDSKLIDFLGDRSLADDAKNPGDALLDVSQEQSEYETSGKTYIDALKYLKGEAGKTNRSRLGIFSREGQNKYNKRLDMIKADKNIWSNQVNNATVEISKYNSQVNSLQKQLVPGSSPAIQAMNAPILAQIQSLQDRAVEEKGRIGEANDKVWAALDQEYDIYVEQGVSTPLDADRKTILETINALAQKLGSRDEAVSKIQKQLKDPKSPMSKALNKKGNSLGFYGINVYVGDSP